MNFKAWEDAAAMSLLPAPSWKAESKQAGGLSIEERRKRQSRNLFSHPTRTSQCSQHFYSLLWVKFGSFPTPSKQNKKISVHMPSVITNPHLRKCRIHSCLVGARAKPSNILPAIKHTRFLFPWPCVPWFALLLPGRSRPDPGK